MCNKNGIHVEFNGIRLYDTNYGFMKMNSLSKGLLMTSALTTILNPKLGKVFKGLGKGIDNLQRLSNGKQKKNYYNNIDQHLENYRLSEQLWKNWPKGNLKNALQIQSLEYNIHINDTENQPLFYISDDWPKGNLKNALQTQSLKHNIRINNTENLSTFDAPTEQTTDEKAPPSVSDKITHVTERKKAVEQLSSSDDSSTPASIPSPNPKSKTPSSNDMLIYNKMHNSSHE